ncbi:TonB-dependent receptor plug domain-containing protein [Methyloterricola oryzae]|uniref:TonB-dependent receptor plug domain-containing protein n=1 Tax=Methyloterricola oryzae TaxID=1495050 RepID=UPI0005EAEDAB|nr:TonB-dependent receptor [Methyloterricola oryzae]
MALLAVQATAVVLAAEATLPVVRIVGEASEGGPAEGAVTRTIQDREAIERSEERDLNGVFQGLPGVTLQSSNTRTALSGLSLRGASAGLGQISLDGVPLYSSTPGAFNLTGFPADSIEQVDVVRGAMAPRYGSRALGGVIRLNSRDRKETGVFGHLEGGSYGTLSETLGGSWAGEGMRGTLTASRDDMWDGPSTADPANGNRERDNFWQHQVLGRFHAQPSGEFKLNGTLLYGASRADGDASGLTPALQVGLMDDPNSDSYTENWVAQTTASADISQAWTSSLQLGFTRNRQNGHSRGTPFGFDQHLLMSRWTNTHPLFGGDGDGSMPALHFVWGGEARYEEGDNASLTPAFQLGGERNTLSGLTELRGQWGRWSGLLGTTLDHYSDFETNPTFYAGLNGWVLDTLQVRASGGHGYRPPTLKEWYFEPVFGNRNLRPEQGWSAETGVDWLPTSTQRLSVTGYYADYRDLIRVAFAPTSPLLLTNINVPRAQLWGFEVEGETTWGYGLMTGINYTYTHSEDLDTGEELVRQPQHQGRVYGQWRIPETPLSLWVETVYRSGNYQDQAHQIHIDEAVRINAQLAYHYSPQWQLYVRGENLADDRTEELYSFTYRGATVLAGFRGGF